jgi:hypothetical protein
LRRPHPRRRLSLRLQNSVQADFAVELGADDETLEFPWTGAGGLRYYDLKRQPELIRNIEEARRFPELGEFLAAANSPSGILETAKCDAWSTPEMTVEDEIFGAACKFCSYVDLLFSAAPARFSFPEHEDWAKRVVQLLKRVPEVPVSAEFLIRRCFYYEAGKTQAGFYITFYLFGYGDDEVWARRLWGIGLKLVGNAIRQASVSG